MDTQDVFNVAVALIGGLGGWILRMTWAEVKAAQQACSALANKVAEIEVLVAGQYVKRDSFDKVVEAIFKKLDKIEDKIDGKADKKYG